MLEDDLQWRKRIWIVYYLVHRAKFDWKRWCRNSCLLSLYKCAQMIVLWKPELNWVVIRRWSELNFLDKLLSPNRRRESDEKQSKNDRQQEKNWSPDQKNNGLYNIILAEWAFKWPRCCCYRRCSDDDDQNDGEAHDSILVLAPNHLPWAKHLGVQPQWLSHYHSVRPRARAEAVEHNLPSASDQARKLVLLRR